MKIKLWFASARPKTLIAGISPVLIGTALSAQYTPISWWIFALCLLFSLSLQIGTNWANDYFDFVKGADTSSRKGPPSALLTGAILPHEMKTASFAALFAASLFALPLLIRIGWAFLPLAALCLLSAIYYTAGKHALGYLGLGDLLVFLFYGVIGTVMTAYSQTLFSLTGMFIAAIIPGALSTAILCVNNLRDIDEDLRARKMTLVARLGKRFGQIEYSLCLAAPVFSIILLSAIGFPKNLYLTYLALPLAIEPLWIVWRKPESMNRALALTAQFLALFSILFCFFL